MLKVVDCMATHKNIEILFVIVLPDFIGTIIGQEASHKSGIASIRQRGGIPG